MKILYFEKIHRDESNDILYDIIYRCILVEKYSQNCTFSIRSDGGSMMDDILMDEYIVSMYYGGNTIDLALIENNEI